MSTANQNLSSHSFTEFSNAEQFSFGIVVADWNKEITHALYNGAIDFLQQAGVKQSNIKSISVPGSFELTAGADLLIQHNKYDAIICLGCVIQGETKHFDFICNAVANGLSHLTIVQHIPVIFGVLTTDNLQQAIDRSGGIHGNKGIEAAATALKMAQVANDLKK